MVLSRLEKLRGPKNLQGLNQKDLLISCIYALDQKGDTILSEGELASFVYFMRNTLPFRYKFSSKPIPHSYDLLSDVEELRSMAHLRPLVEIIGAESIPKYSYSLTLPGKVRAKEIYDSLPNDDRERIVDAINKAKMLIKQ